MEGMVGRVNGDVSPLVMVSRMVNVEVMYESCPLYWLTAHKFNIVAYLQEIFIIPNILFYFCICYLQLYL